MLPKTSTRLGWWLCMGVLLVVLQPAGAGEKLLAAPVVLPDGSPAPDLGNGADPPGAPEAVAAARDDTAGIRSTDKPFLDEEGEVVQGPRQGGDTCATATVISGLPYHDTGTTVGRTHNYDEVCPYSGSTAPDVAYSFAPAGNVTVDITLCNGSTYDTKLYVYRSSCPGTLVACNDDACPGYVSQLLGVSLTGGSTYYIIIDGYGGASGNYVLDVTEGVPPPACPEGSLYAQPVHTPTDAWNAFTSAVTTQFSYAVYENFSGVSGSICDLHWWGLSLFFSSGWYACDPTGMTFQIKFYQDNAGLPGAQVCSYTVTPTITDTGLLYAGFHLYYFEVPSLAPCCALSAGWVSIQSQLNGADCAFLWMSGTGGDANSLQWDGSAYNATGYDLGLCLTGCSVTCPPGAVLEGEPCGDDTNGGCNMTTPAFEPIAIGETVCGTAWANPSLRDTDWYQLTTTETMRFTWSAEAEFPVRLFIIQGAGPNDCTAYTSLGTTTGEACTSVSLTYGPVGPGTYWFWVGSSEWFDLPCPADYVATLEGCTAVHTQNFETDLGGYTINNGFGDGNGLWHRTTSCESAGGAHSTPTSLYYGVDATCNYDAGKTEGVVTSPLISLFGLAPPIELSFKYYLQTEGAPSSYDQASVEVSQNGGPFTAVAHNNPAPGRVTLTDPSNAWLPATVDLWAMAGSTIQVRFRFRTVDDYDNDQKGFYVDDVTVCGVTGPCNPPPAPFNPVPENGATNVSTDADLSWNGCAVTEGFEDGNLSEYTVLGGTHSVSAAAAHDGSFGLESDDPGSIGWAYRHDPTVRVAQGNTVSYWVKLRTDTNQRAYCGFGATAAGTYSAVLAPNTGELLIQRNVNYDFLDIGSVAQAWTLEKWYRVEVGWGLGGTITARLFDSNGTTLLNTVTAHDTTFTSGGIAFRAFGISTAYFDTITRCGPVPPYVPAQATRDAPVPRDPSEAIGWDELNGAWIFPEAEQDVVVSPADETSPRESAPQAPRSVVEPQPASLGMEAGPLPTWYNVRLPEGGTFVPRSDLKAPGERRHETQGSSLDPVTSAQDPVTSYEAPADRVIANVAIFQDSNPWGSTWNQTILAANGISYTIYGAGSMGVVDLSPYDKVIVSSVQTTAFYNTLEANRAWFEAYASAGGHLDLHLASSSYDPVSGKVMPGGFVVSAVTPYDDVTIVDAAHPVLTTPHPITGAELDGWNSSAHGYFTAIPTGAHEIIEIAGSGEPCAMDLPFGAGRIFATDQPVEWNFGASYNYLENTILYYEVSCPTTYDVYLGTTNPPTTLICEDTPVATCDPGPLFAATTYYWQVVATNASGSTPGPVWSFTTRKANRIGAIPADQSSLWRSSHNVIRLTFDANLMAPPAAGQVLIQRLQDVGAFGADQSASFTFAVENDGGGYPRILKIQEAAFPAPSVLPHRTWYGIRNTGGWTKAANFEVQYVVQVGDANIDLKVLANDLSAMFPKIPTNPALDQERADINGDGKVLANDLSVVFPRIPSNTVSKPSGH